MTRNSAIADKPRDAIAWLTSYIKHATSPKVLPCRIWSFYVKGCRYINTGEPPNSGALLLHCLGMVRMEGVADPQETRPSPTRVTASIW